MRKFVVINDQGGAQSVRLDRIIMVSTIRAKDGKWFIDVTLDNGVLLRCFGAFTNKYDDLKAHRQDIIAALEGSDNA